jgi:hypothetical protein
VDGYHDPKMDADISVFQEMYAELEDNLTTDKGKSLANQYETFQDV